jgi:hypothetical protein
MLSYTNWYTEGFFAFCRLPSTEKKHTFPPEFYGVIVVRSSYLLYILCIGKQITSSFAKLFCTKYLHLVTETSGIYKLVILTLCKLSFCKGFQYL